jgi:hypothetical protein
MGIEIGFALEGGFKDRSRLIHLEKLEKSSISSITSIINSSPKFETSSEKSFRSLGSMIDDSDNKIDDIGIMIDDSEKKIDDIGIMIDDSGKKIDDLGSMIDNKSVIDHNSVVVQQGLQVSMIDMIDEIDDFSSFSKCEAKLKIGDRVEIISTGDRGILSMWNRQRTQATIELDDGSLIGWIGIGDLRGC